MVVLLFSIQKPLKYFFFLKIIKLCISLTLLYFLLRKFPFITTCRGVASVSPDEASLQVNKREYFLTKDHRFHLDDDYYPMLEDEKFLLQKRQDDQEDLEVSNQICFPT